MTARAFARGRRISSQRLFYWSKRFRAALTPTFVAVTVPETLPSRPPPSRIEIVSGDVVVRLREDVDIERLAGIVQALARRTPAC